MSREAFVEWCGSEIDFADLQDRRSQDFVRLLADGRYPYASFVRCTRSDNGLETVELLVSVERPQRAVVPIKRREHLLAAFSENTNPAVFALREDFPRALHRILTPEGWPIQLCLDEREWREVRSQWTAFSFLERIRWWLSATSQGKLHHPDQPLEPVLLHDDLHLILPGAAEDLLLSQNRLFVRSANMSAEKGVIVLSTYDSGNPGEGGFYPIPILTQPQEMQPLEAVPRDLSSLRELVQKWGVDITEELRVRLSGLAGDPLLLNARPLIVLIVPVVNAPGEAAQSADIKAFIAPAEYTLARLGIEIGVFYSSAGAGVSSAGDVARRLTFDKGSNGEGLPIGILSVHQGFTRSSAAVAAGVPVSNKSIVLVGAGSLGSHVSDILQRDGWGCWTVIDDDVFFPHNIQRHRLGVPNVGKKKANALASYFRNQLNATTAVAVCHDVTGGEQSVDDALSNCSCILDASASVEVSRYLSDSPATVARRVSVFLNPAGSDAVLLAEDSERVARLDSLEAQYYRALIGDDSLKDHLRPPLGQYRYSGSCRSVSLQITEAQVSALSGVIAGEVREALSSDEPSIVIWRRSETGLSRQSVQIGEVRRQRMAGWEVVADTNFLKEAHQLRAEALPDETGGVLVGVLDMYRQRILLVSALPAPADSKSNSSEFERGVHGLKNTLTDVSARTAGQVQYVGEWHSHPTGVPPKTSSVDIQQLAWLAAERGVEDAPSVMVILGDDDDYTINMSAVETP